MKTQADLHQEFLEQAALLVPLAKGCLSQNKNGFVFFHRRGGKINCMSIRPECVDNMKVAIANGKKLQALVIEHGIKLVNLYRKETPLGKPGRPRKIIDVQPGSKRKPGRPKKIKYEF